MNENGNNQLRQETEKRKKKLRFWLFLNLGIFVMAVTVVVLVAIFFWHNTANNLPDSATLTKNTTEQNSKNSRSKLDKTSVLLGDKNLTPFAVMIDNHIAARPWFGVSQANIVYEAEAEGGITRFLAIFSGDAKINKIGPIRSARPYFLDWANEYNPLYVHVGGSPEALANIIKQGINDMNEFSAGNYFWRDKNRSAPHNVYTNTDLMGAYLADQGYVYEPYFSWQYKNEKNFSQRPEKQEIVIPYSLSSYVVSWHYNREHNNYQRYFANNPQIDGEGKAILAKNIILQYNRAQEIDEKLRLHFDVLGKGMAKICREGTCEDGIWIKKSLSTRTRYYDLQDNEIRFIPGTTWVEVLRADEQKENLNKE